MADSGAAWVLWDLREPLDGAEEPQHRVESEDHLRFMLDSMRDGPLGIVELTRSDRTAGVLRMGIGRGIGGVAWIKTPPRDIRYALATDRIVADDVEFSCWGQPSMLSAKCILDADEVIEIAVHFFLYDEVPPWVEWALPNAV
ncbi:MAG TPA: hypothetical protein VMZ71_10365 [Gemmataceae bacterium]|nr:hypothetical protein [Gemmataceae bacterium]